MKKYKKFVTRFILLVPILFVVYLSSIYFLYFDSRNDSFTIKIYYDYKENYAKSIKSQKIVFVSGSNNFLGIRASQIENYFNIPTVNLSVHAGLRTEYILYKSKKVLNKGDIVIIPFEYENLMFNGEASIVKNQYLLTYDRDFLDKQDFISQLKILSSISLYNFAFSAYDSFKEFYSDEVKYSYIKHLNRNGDMLDREKHFDLKTKKSLLKLLSPIDLETEGLKEIVKFSKWCDNHGVILYMSYPNMIYRDEYKNKIEYKQYFTFLAKYFNDKNIITIGTPYNAMYPREYFHDSEYHLISKASDIRTKDFINQSKDILIKEIKNKK